MPSPSAGHRLWPILACLAFLTAAPAALHAAGVCHPPPDPSVAYPMYNRLMTMRLPLRQDPATRQWATAAALSGPEALTAVGLHELRHLLAAVFPGKLWVHDASSAWLEANGTQLALRDLIVELNSPADSDHCSHVFQQHLFMAAETHAADTHFDLRQFSDIRVEYHHLFGACQPGQEETVHFYGALRLDKADQACRGLSSAQAASTVAAGLPADLHRLVDRLFFMPSSRYNFTAIDGALTSNNSAPPPILLQSNSRLLAFVIDFRLRVDRPLQDWPQLGAEITERYARLSRHSDDYGVQRQGAAPSCLNYLNFASPPATQLAASCGACYDIAVPVSVNISLSESADIRPPQCETISSVRADASRRVIESRAILASLAQSNITAHLFLPSGPADAYFDIRSVSCSAQPKRLVADLTLRLRARHPALLRYPLVLQAGLQRNLNAHLVQRHLGLASVRLSGPVLANTANCDPTAPSFDNNLAATAAQCRNTSTNGSVSILRHNFQLSLGRQSLLDQVPTTRPDLTTGLVRFLLTAAMSRIDQHFWLLTRSLSVTATRRNAAASSADVSAVIQVEAAYATADRQIDTASLNARFVQAVSELQPDFGPLAAADSSMTMERRNCSSWTATGLTGPPVQPATTPAPRTPDTTAGIDASHALRLMFTVSSKLLYGGRIGDYLVASGLNAALRRAGLRDIDDVDLTARDCQAGDTCRIVAMVLCGNHSSSNSTTGVHHVTLSALAASLSGDPLLRPADLRADIVPTQPTQLIPASSVIYRYSASAYFNRPPPSLAGSASIVPVRLSILWRLVSVNVSAPLAYRSLPSDPPSSGAVRLRFLLEQLLVDLLGSRLLSWPLVAAYKSDASQGRLDAAVALESGSLASLAVEASAVADRLPLASFLRLSDLWAQPAVRRDAVAAFDSALLLQSHSLFNFVSNATLQAMPESDFQRLLSGKLRFVQSSIFSGQPGRPSLLSFEYRAVRRADASIRVDALSRIVWRSGDPAAFDEASLKRLIDTELEALHANVNVFPMVFDSRRTALRLLDTRSGMATQHWCDLLLQFRSLPADIAVAAADASWLPVADRLSTSLGGSASHVTVLSLSSDPASTIDALATVPQPGPSSCSEVAARLLKMSTADNRLVAARSLSDNILAPDDTSANLSVLVRHSALLPAYYPLRQADEDRDSVGDYFCFLTSWAHALFNRDRSRGVCVSNLAEAHRIRLNPLSDASSPALRLSTVSAFTEMPPETVMQRFWSFKNFYLASNETFIDLDRMRLQLSRPNISGGDTYASLIISQLPPAPPHRVVNITTTTAPATSATPRPTVTSAATPPVGFATASKSTTAAALQATTSTATTTPQPPPPPPTPPVGPYYTPVDRVATLSISLGVPSDPWLGRYFHAAQQPNRTVAAATADYLIRSALAQSLLRSAWQVAADEILFTRVNVDTGRMTIDVGLDLLLPVDRNGAELASVLRTGVDQSMLLSTVFSKRSYSVSIANLHVRRYLHRPPVAPPNPGAMARVSVDHRMLVRLSDSAPDFLRLRASGDSDSGLEDLLLDFLFQQLVTDACGSERLPGRPQLLQYKADGQLAMLHLRYDINQRAGAAGLRQFSGEFAAAWQRMEQAASLRDILYLDIRPGPPPPNRGLLLYQMLRLESYINKKSLMSLPSDYLAMLLRPKIEYVMQQVFPGGSSSVPQFLDVDITYTKKDGALEVLALTRVAIAPGFRLAKLEQRLQLHVMQRLEQLANDINLVPSVFSVGRTDVRVVDLKEGLSQQYWCDLVYSFTVDGPGLPKQGFELATFLSQLLVSRLPQYTHLERLAVLQSGPSSGSAALLEVQALVTLSSARSLPFADAASLLMKAATAASLATSTRLVTRAVAAPFHGPSAAASFGPGSSAHFRNLKQAVTFVGSADLTAQPDAEKLANYACHLYQSSLESAHWYALYVVPHSCSAVTAVTPVRVPVSQQPALSLPGLQLNISASVVSQTEATDIQSSAGRAFLSALAIKNFYFNSGEIVLSNGVQLHASAAATSKAPDTAASTATRQQSKTTPPPSAASTANPGIGNATRPPVVLYYNLQLKFPVSNATWDYLSEPDTPMVLFLAESLLRDALSANSTVSGLARHLSVTNASLVPGDSTNATRNATDLGFGRVLTRFAAPSAVASSEYLRAAVTEAVSKWPMAARLFTDRPIVNAWPEFESPRTLPPLPQNSTTPRPSPSSTTVKTRQRRAATSSSGSSSAMFVEHRLQLSAAPSLPVYLRYRDIPLREDPLLAFLTERLLNFALRRWTATNGRSESVSGDWPKLIWLRSDNSSVTLCIRYPVPAGLTERAMMDGFASAWVAVNRELAGCSLCLARHQELRRVATGDTASETVGLLIYQRLQFDRFVGRNTMRKLDHDDLNQLMRHRLRFILGRLYPGGGGVGNLSLAGFDFECYGRNSTVVTFLLVRLLARADVSEAAVRRHVADQLQRLVNDEHVLPAQLSTNGSDLRLLARRTGLPAGALDWLDIQATFEYAEDDSGLGGYSLHGYALAAGARRHLEKLLARGGRPISIVQLRLLRWKRLATSVFGQHHQLVTVLATLASTAPPNPDATPRDLRAQLGNATGLAGPNLTLPLQDFDHEPRHYDQHHLQLLHTGVAVEQLLYLVDSGPAEDSSIDIGDQLTSDFLCLLLASAFRQRGSARLRLVDDSCAARVASRSFMAPHPLSTRRIPATAATAYFTLHNSSQTFNPDEATDTIGQLASSLNAYADVLGRAFATGDVAPIQPVPIYQLLRFTSAAFPGDLRNASSSLYLDSSETIKRALAVYLRGVSNLFSGQVTDVRFDSGSILVLVDYQVYPRLLNTTQAASHIEVHTEAAFASDGPFHGLQLDREGSFVSTAPIAGIRQPKLDKTDQQSVPVAIYCILGVACFLLLVLSTLLCIRLLRMRRNNSGRSRVQQASTSSHRRSLLCAEDPDDAEKGARRTGRSTAARANLNPVPRIDLNDGQGEEPACSANAGTSGPTATSGPSGGDPIRRPSTQVPPRLPQPPENRRASSSSRRASTVAATTAAAPPAPNAALTAAPTSAAIMGSSASLV